MISCIGQLLIYGYECCILMVAIMISIQRYIYKYKYKTQKRADSVVSDTNGLLISWLRHEERDTILTMLTPSPRAAHLVVFKISVGRDPKIPTLRLNGPISTLNWLFFKNLKFSGPSLPGMTSSPLQPHFLSGVNYDNSDGNILCTRA